MGELAEGVARAALARIAETGVERARVGLELLAVAVEEQARITAHNGEHAYGTPTPARPGEGPAKISGTLLASIGHNEITPSPGGWSTRVGPRTGYTPPYGGRRRTSAHRYGYYLETGDHGITYPWLKPAGDRSAKTAALLFAKVFNETGWTTGG
ncbi:hypothetical protein [Streptacidiphilus albus]|uniref:hypothetical protein n=1 Tax=Streptacidiphilus albus TaxID=105425 RepID=UPI00054C7D61|nr:hypothetical protein [Streptacidiphilus albus]